VKATLKSVVMISNHLKRSHILRMKVDREVAGVTVSANFNLGVAEGMSAAKLADALMDVTGEIFDACELGEVVEPDIETPATIAETGDRVPAIDFSKKEGPLWRKF